MLRLAAAGIQGALGVVDDDCDSLERRENGCMNVIRTDSHDVETMLLNSSAFEKVLVEYGKDSKLAALEEKEGCSVREALARRALLFGNLRWLAVRNAWSVPFEKKFSPWRFADPAVWQFDQDDLYASFAAEVLGISPEDVAGLVSALPKADPWAIIQGHDAITILAIGLRTVLGSVQISDTNLAKALRLAFDVAAFRSTALHDSVMAWQLTNQPYVIL